MLLGVLGLGLVTIASSAALTDHVVWMDMGGGSHGGPGSLGLPYTEVRAMAGVSAADVWAVGVNRGPGGEQSRIQHWDGAAWTVTPVTRTKAQSDVFNGVASSPSGGSWAVGYSSGIDGLQEGTLIEHWDGDSWSLVPSPNPTDAWNELDGIVALSPSDAWAVGYSKHDFWRAEALVLHWNGVAWDGVPVPNPGGSWNQLTAVAARGPKDVWAVGWQQSENENRRTSLIEHYDGKDWSVVRVDGGQELTALAGAAESMWAAGPSTLRLSQGVWSRDQMPVTVSQGATIWSASASGPADAWIAGMVEARGERALLEHWDGVSWKLVTLPARPLANRLTAVVSLSNQDAWVAGTYLAGQPRTLVEHWDGRLWSVVSSPD
jgi:hypothetical protein